MKKVLALTFMILLLTTNSFIFGQDIQFEKVAEIPIFQPYQGNAVNIFGVYDNHLFTDRISDLDISAPLSPQPVDSTLVQRTQLFGPWSDSGPEDIWFIGNYALIDYSEGYQGRLGCYNVTDLCNPVHLWTITPGENHHEEFGDVGEKVIAIEESNNYLILCLSSRLSFVNLSTGSERLIAPNYFSYRRGYDLVVDDNFIYLACGEDGLRVLDITDIENPTGVSLYTNVNDTRSITFYENHVFMTDGEDILVFDVNQPENPEMVHRIVTGSQVYKTVIRDDLMYICNGNAGLQIMDISDPQNPVSIDHIDLNGNITNIVFNNSYAYIEDDSGFIHIVDITSPVLEPVRYGWDKYLAASVVANNYLVGISQDKYSLSFFNLEDPSQTVVKPFSGWFSDDSKFKSEDNYLYLLGSDLTIYDISDPTEFEQVNVFEFDRYEGYDNFFIDGNYLYLLEHYEDLKVLDISDPENPVHVYQLNYEIDAGARFLKKFGNYLYIGDGNSYQLLDVTIPDLPVVHDRVMVTNSIKDISFSGNYAYYARGQEGVTIADLTNVEEPVLVDTLSAGTDTGAEYLYVQDNYLFIVYTQYYYPGYITVYDISDPEVPVELNTYNGLPSYFRTPPIFYENMIITQSNSLTFTEFTLPGDSPLDSPWNKLASVPMEFKIAKAYPNPFNPSLNVEISLPQTGNLEVSIFNLLGQKVANLANQPYSAGTHSFTFNGSNLGSGAYFVKASMPEQNTQLQKVILIK